jgi:acyl carrier protein
MDNRAMIIDGLRKAVANGLDIPIEKVVPSARFKEDLGADSLDLVEIIIDMEEKFGISIPDEEAQNFHTIQDAIDYLDKAGKL